MDDNEAANGRRNFSSLEIDEDDGEGLVAGLSRVRLRTSVRSNPSFVDQKRDGASDEGFRGLLRSKTVYVLRNCLILGALAWLVFLYIASMDEEVESLTAGDPRGIHQSSFGGEKNTGTLAGAEAHDGQEEHDIHSVNIPLDNSGQPVQSISQENIINHNGHYWHDPHNSPFASGLYNRSVDELDEEQNKFLARQNASKIKYGSWGFVDPYHEENHAVRPAVDFTDYPDHDAPLSDFVGEVWQNDQNYTEKLIEEAKKLIYRMKEAIFDEYGLGSLKEDGTQKVNAILGKRAELFKVITEEFSVNSNGEAVNPKTNEKLPGIAYMTEPVMDALSRKLLHALITSGYLFVVQVGDGAAAGHGNNFFQSSIMQFHYIMEPVFDFLGINLVSRNMAMKDGPILLSALAGGDLYGEADILWHVPSDSDTDGETALLYRQTILSGERIPIILGKPTFAEKDIWWGNLQPGDEICRDSHLEVCDLDAFNSACWEDRKFKPKKKQDKEIPRESYPSYRKHQLESRKLAMLLLEALSNALAMWLKGISRDGFPLSANYWHVGPLNDNAREAIRTSADDDEITECEKMMGEELKMVCRVEMHGRSEYLPRIRENATSIRSLLPGDASEIANTFNDVIYDGIDVLPWGWRIPDEQVDVHGVAILTSAPPPDGNSEEPEEEDYVQDLEDEEEEDAARGETNHAEPEEATPVDDGKNRDRRQLDGEVSPGKGWLLTNSVAGFCDGSAQSECGRSRENTCLLAGHNDYQSGILGDALSGWLVLEIRGVTEGIILLRFDATEQMDPATDGWLTVNNDEDGGVHKRRFLLPDDFEFEYAVDKEVTTLSKEEFHAKGVTLRDGVTVFPIMVDSTLQDRIVSDDGETFRLALRTKSTTKPRNAVLMVTHVYYA